MDNCIFCKIAAGIIPSTTVYENEDVRVIADIAPANLGHLLILPKEHAADFTELSEEKAAVVMKTAHKIVKAMKKGLKPDGIKHPALCFRNSWSRISRPSYICHTFCHNCT